MEFILELFTHDIWMIFAVLSVLCVVLEVLKVNAKKTSASKTIVMEKPFESEWSNELYALSFAKPFSEVINPDESSPRVKDIEKVISEAGLSHKLNYRVYSVIQLLIIVGGFFVFFLFMAMSEQLGYIFQFLLNVELGVESPEYRDNLAMIIIGCILVSGIMPKLYLSRKAKRNEYYFKKDLPILQLFIILILRAKRPVSELLYVLSKTRTTYKELFSNAYRIYLRNHDESFKGLYKSFEDTKMSGTINILAEFNEYSKDDSLNLLENNLEDIIQETNNMKRKKDITGNVLSQGSMVFPMLSVILLGLLPFVMYGLNSLTLATQSL